MQFRKNSFSYILWAVYSVLTQGFLALVCITVSYGLQMDTAAGLVAAGLVFVVCLLAALLFRLIRKNHPMQIRMDWFENIGTGLIATGLFVFGFIYRILLWRPDYAAGNIYLQWAFVGTPVPGFVQGIQHWYVQLLHGLFLLFGNRASAAYGLSIVLQILAVLAGFQAIRRLAGDLPALFSLAYWMASPFGTGQALLPGPQMLYFMCFLFGLLLLSYVHPVRAGILPLAAFTGLYFGLLIYLNALGIVLLLMAFGLLWAREDYENLEPPHPVPASRRFGVLGIVVLCTLLGLILFFLVDSVFTGLPVPEVLRAYAKLYFKARAIRIPYIDQVPPTVILMAITVLLTLGIPVWLFREKTDIQGMLALGSLGILVLSSLMVLTSEANGAFELITFMTALAGCAVNGLIHVRPFGAVKEKQVKSPEKQPEKLPETIPATEPEQEPAPAPVELLKAPLPTKPVKPHKEMDYDIEVADDDDYDIKD